MAGRLEASKESGSHAPELARKPSDPPGDHVVVQATDVTQASSWRRSPGCECF
jgi:hypothetical protein